MSRITRLASVRRGGVELERPDQVLLHRAAAAVAARRIALERALDDPNEAARQIGPSIEERIMSPRMCAAGGIVERVGRRRETAA